MLEDLGCGLGYSTVKQGRVYVWQEQERAVYAFHILASGLVGRVLHERSFPAEQTFIVFPGGRASLVSYKAQRDPALAESLKGVRVIKYRLLRTLLETPVLTRETLEKQSPATRWKNRGCRY